MSGLVGAETTPRTARLPGRIEQSPATMECAALPMATTRTSEIAASSTVASGRCSRSPSRKHLRFIVLGISMAASVCRNICRARFFPSGMIEPPDGSAALEHIRVEHIGRPLPLEKSYDIVRGHDRHLGASLDRSGGQMWREHYVGSLQSRMDERLVLVDIQCRSGDLLVFQGGNKCSLVDHRSP